MTTIAPPSTAEPAAPSVGPKPKKTKIELTGQELLEARFGRKLIAPGLALAILITQVPFLVTIFYSFQNWNLAKPEEKSFAGLANYGAVFTNGYFLPAVLNTVVIVGSSVILSLLLGLLFATLLDRRFPGQALARTLLITPFLVMPAAAALVWKWTLLDASAGLFQWVSTSLGLPAVAWNTDHPGFTIVMVLTWQYTPFMMLILLAGLQSQDGSILEAADVDGASKLQTFRFMTLPHLRNYAELSGLLGTVMMSQVFDPVSIMTKGSGHSKTLPYLLYERAFIGQQVGETAAYGVITVILTIIVTTVALRTVFKVFTEEAR